MKHYWKHAGLTESGAALAEPALKPMLRLVAPLGSRELARIVVDEAAYQLWELTTRDPEFQRGYLEDAPAAAPAARTASAHRKAMEDAIDPRLQIQLETQLLTLYKVALHTRPQVESEREPESLLAWDAARARFDDLVARAVRNVGLKKDELR